MTEDQDAEAADDEEVADEAQGEDVPEEESEAGETEAETAEEPEDALEDGDFVRLAYTARAVESGQLVDTTDQEVAQEEGMDDGEQDFSPRVVVLGEGHLFGPVEDDIVGKGVGDTGEVTVPATEAFGEHDPEDVRTISVDKIPEDDRYPGAHVTIEGDHGHVETVIGGRARVDFNHPLAGDDIEYEYEVLDDVEDRIERAKGLFSMYIDADVDMWIDTDEEEEEVTVHPDEDEDEEGDDAEAEGEDGEGDEEPPEPTTEVRTVEKETLYVEATPQLMMDQQWMFSKQQIAQQLVDHLGVDRMIVQETLGEGGGMMGSMGGMMGGMGGGDVEDALEDADVDADEIVEELEDG